MKKFMVIPIITALVLLIFIAGITGEYLSKSNTLNSLTVSVERVSIQEIRLTYAKLNLHVNFTNPSTSSINDLSATYDIFISGVQIGQGSLSQIDLPSQSSSQHTTLLTINFTDVASAVIESIQTYQFTLELKGIAQTRIFMNLINIEQSFSNTYSYEP
jgi:LEA14-like dessication related protein